MAGNPELRKIEHKLVLNKKTTNCIIRISFDHSPSPTRIIAALLITKPATIPADDPVWSRWRSCPTVLHLFIMTVTNFMH